MVYGCVTQHTMVPSPRPFPFKTTANNKIHHRRYLGDVLEGKNPSLHKKSLDILGYSKEEKPPPTTEFRKSFVTMNISENTPIWVYTHSSISLPTDTILIVTLGTDK